MPCRSSWLSSKSPGRDGFLDLGVDGRDGLEPLLVLELADRLAVDSDRQPEADRRRIDEHAVGDERGVDARQGVDHALRLDASERPAAQRDVEALSFHVERLGAMDAEANSLHACSRPRLLDPFLVLVEGVNAGRPGRGESCQAAFAAADLEDPGTVELDQRLDPAVFDVEEFGDVHD